MHTLKHTVLTAALMLAAAATAAPNAAETNRQITRGNGPADPSLAELQLVTRQGAAKTPHIINRYTRTASDREAIRSTSQSNAVSSTKLTTEPTAFQKNHHI